LRVPSAGSRFARSRKFQGSGDPGLQDSKVAGFQGSKITRLRNPRLQVSMVSKLQDFRVLGYRVPKQKPFAGDLAGIPYRKFRGNLSGRLNKTCGFSLSFDLLDCIFLCLMLHEQSGAIKFGILEP
jgi:hypothetical protein